MGCGKSSVGRELSALLCWSYADLDAVIEERAGRSIPEIFASDGEAAFRHMELDSLKHLVSDCADPMGCRKPCYPSGRRGRGPSLAMGGIVSDTPPDLHEACNMILSLGGGTVMTPECAEIIHRQTLCIYLKASVDTLVGRLESEAEGRPMLNSDVSLRERITHLMEQRSATYESTSHHIIDTDGKTIAEIAQEIATFVK